MFSGLKQMIFKSATAVNSQQVSSVLLDMKDTDYYSMNVDLQKAAQSVRQVNDIVKSAIEADKLSSNDLKKLDQSAREYLKVGGLCGRVLLKNHIKNLIHKAGVNALVVGGRSSGKSLLFSTIMAEEQAHPEHPLINIIRIDGRVESNMLSAIKRAVGTDAKQTIKDFVTRLPIFSVKGAKKNLEFTMKEMLSPMKTLPEAMGQLSYTLQGGVSHNVLLIDAANRYVPGTWRKEDEYKELYESIIVHTKQLSKMSVFQITSSHQAFTHRLSELGCKTDHFSHVFVVAEPSPKEALDWLEGMGVPENLRYVLVNLFGGHVHDICWFLSDLPDALEADKVTLRMAGYDAVLKAINSWIGSGGSYKEIKTVLQEVARKGFYPMVTTERMVRHLTSTNVCTALTPNSKEYHVPPTLRRQRDGITPESQLMRLMIAYTLEELDKTRKSKGLLW